MAFKDALDAIPTSGRTHSCRICQIIDEWPEADADWPTVTPERAAAENLSYWTDDDGE